jgi:hypothetical protein
MKGTNLVETIFSKNFQFESGILCTYGLNLNFFENYLMKLESLYSCDNICILTDSSTYDSFIKESYVPRWLNKKYLVNSLRTNGVFHSKLYMFASEKRAVIGIGSANLTRDGIASNLELLSTFEISGKDQTYAYLLRDCIAYVRQLALITKSKNAIDRIDMFNQLCQAYVNGGPPGTIHFVHNLDKPIIEAILEYVHGQRISKIEILSPFFDTGLQPLKVLQETFPGASFEIYFQQKKSNFPKETFHEIKTHPILMVYRNVERYLHGKAILLSSDDGTILFKGSANFTYPALLAKASKGNYEIGLLGRVDKETKDIILCPTGKRADKVKDVNQIEVVSSREFEPERLLIDYVVEAVLKEDMITVEVNHDVPAETFSPKRIKLLDFNGASHEENLTSHFVVKVTPNIKKKLPGKLAVQFIGQDSKGAVLESNISWLIELEEKNKDSMHKKLRRIYNDPFELISVLHEILESGSEEDLKIFLLRFDIPLDLVLPPRTYSGPGIVQSKGNIEGILPKHHSYSFSAKILSAYTDCLRRLYNKIQMHVRNPQVNRINNFVMITSSLYSLIWFINNEVIYERHKNLSSISPGVWLLVRDYYNMLFKFIGQSWHLVWSTGGYREAVNAKITQEESGEPDNSIGSFEHYLIEEYSPTLKEWIIIALKTTEMFEDLKETLRVKTESGGLVEPCIFHHNNLQPQEIQKLKDAIEITKNHLMVFGYEDVNTG